MYNDKRRNFHFIFSCLFLNFYWIIYFIFLDPSLYIFISADLEIDYSPPKTEEGKEKSDVNKDAVNNADMTIEIVKEVIDDVMVKEQMDSEENQQLGM